ncbi:hypothetical protein Tsubulata_005657 [Turnera subulata]|uniref:DUF7722 domain-containing protein n=1 Tax=Turnera subulata TaxID=218843 RepID=A0A9Q0F2I1_9ROSI|nr:hypothetical protein Tsubulata_005657 [Turnera subulata]
MSGTSFINTVFALPHLITSTTGFNPNQGSKKSGDDKCSCFQMPLHYPRYKKRDYETMPEERLDCLLKQYGLPAVGDVNEKRKFAMGAFLWPEERDEL